MAETQKLTIQLYSSHNRYRLNADGSFAVAGNVIVFSATGLEVQNIEMTFKGEVHYTKTDCRGNTRPATGVIFNLKGKMFKTDEKTFTSFPPGTQCFWFDYGVHSKRHLPSASENVSYVLEAKLISGKEKSIAKTSLPIDLYNPPVFRLEDLGTLHARTNRTFFINCCCFKLKDAVGVEAILNKTSLIVGTDAELDLRLVVHNFTNRELIPQVSFERLTTGNNSTSTMLSRVIGDPVEKNTGNNVIDFEIQADSKNLTETVYTICSLSVKYVLKIRFKGSALKLNIPIKVGVHGIEPAIPTLQHGLSSSVSAGAELFNDNRTHSIDAEPGSAGEDGVLV